MGTDACHGVAGAAGEAEIGKGLMPSPHIVCVHDPAERVLANNAVVVKAVGPEGLTHVDRAGEG